LEINQKLLALTMSGAERNVLVYDSRADTGELTLRLIELMKFTQRIYSVKHEKKLTDIYLSKPDFIFLFSKRSDLFDILPICEDFQTARILGLDVHFDDGIYNTDGYLYQKFKDAEYRLQGCDTNLVVAYNKYTMESILGSY